MRLLDVDTLELHEFIGSQIPKYQYVILSHTWDEGEVSLQDLQAGRGPSKRGYEKIVLTCEQAKRHRYRWAWVDTCCIDKTSSAELSEAINSMYQWYKESAMCYAYLTDVDDDFPYASPRKLGDEPQVSRWFTRAWTLQELIAPLNIIFYGRGWADIGKRSEPNIQDLITNITGIPKSAISTHEPSLSQYSVAQKMSWAAHRFSTRTEDMAYSLLGLFNISMPLLYGEGPKAFVRLQEEILKETDDHSLLCWTVPRSSPRAWTLESVFATSPGDFAESGNIMGNIYDAGSPSVMTNRGLQIHVGLEERRYGKHSHLYFENPETAVFDAKINAVYHGLNSALAYQMSIILVRTPQVTTLSSRLMNRYARLATPTLGRHCTLEMALNQDKPMHQIYINKTLLPYEQDRFGSGGVHLQNIWLGVNLAPLSIGPRPLPLPLSDTDPAFEAERVFYFKSYDEIGNDTLAVESPLAPMTWSRTYGCIKFGFGFRKPPQYTYFVLVVIHAPYEQRRRFISLVWDARYIHFGILSSELSLPALDEYRYHPQTSVFLRGLLDPSHHSTQEGHCWDMHGEISKATTYMQLRPSSHKSAFSRVNFILERENPCTDEGEAAGNRLHFLIRAELEP